MSTPSKQLKITAFYPMALKKVNSPSMKQTKITAFFKTEVESSEDQPTSRETPEQSSASKRKFSKHDFVDERTPTKQKLGRSVKKEKKTTQQRQCPLYKKLPNTTFAMDAFEYGHIAGISYYFLSHYHADHYRGLTRNFGHDIYCSPITGRMLVNHHNIHRKQIVTIELNEPTVIDEVEVTLIDANHCPGAAMFIFKLLSGVTYLHTGDFRASPEMERNPYLASNRIDILYLDTTYCNPRYDFPSQSQCLGCIVSLAVETFERNQKTLFVCGSYFLGKEKVFVAIAEALKLKIWVTLTKRRVLRCQNDVSLDALLAESKREAQIHVVRMTSEMTIKSLTDRLEANEQFTELVAFRPTGWEEGGGDLTQLKPQLKRHNVAIYGIPYSEHSSYSELKKFVKFVKANKVVPTVTSSLTRREEIVRLIESW